MPRVKIIGVPKAKDGAAFSPSKAKKILRESNPTLQGHPITAKQKRWLGWQAGGAKPKAEDGLYVEGGQYKPLSDDTILIGGKKHSEGGTDIHYSGSNVEAEKGETLSLQDDGGAVIMGNMYVPGTTQKFKTVSKTLADKERKVNKRIKDGVDMINTSNPDNKWELLKFNSGIANMRGGRAKLKEITQNKEWLATLQQAMLDHSTELGVDPQEYSKGNLKAKNGLRIDSGKAQVGKHLEDLLAKFKRDNPPTYDSTAPKPVDELGNPVIQVAKPRKDITQLPVVQANSLEEALGNKPATPQRLSPRQRLATSTGLYQDSPYRAITPKINQTTVNQPISTNIIPPTFGDSPVKITGSLTDDDNTMTVAERNNNPGNMKFAPWMTKFGATRGEYASIDNDGSYFAKFPDNESGMKALRQQLLRPKYVGQTVEDAIKMWTGNHPYSIPLGDLAGKRIADLSNDQLDNLIGVITKGEGSKTYNKLPAGTTSTPTLDYQIPTDISGYKQPEKLTLTPDQVQGVSNQFNKVTPTDYEFNFPNLPARRKAPSNAEPLLPTQVLGELYALGTNKQVPVWQAKYQPDLYSPYQVSFQDRLNEDTASFNALQRTMAYNPEALSVLAGQKYGADTQALADQFRTNQQISNDIINKNVSLLNDAKLKNLSLADTQYQRQSEAKSKTKATNQAVLNSISQKMLEHRLENKTLQAYENLYQNYRFDKDGNLQYYGPSEVEALNFKPNSLTNQNTGNQQISQTYHSKTGDTSTRITTYPAVKQGLWNAELTRIGMQNVNSLFNKGKQQGKNTFVPLTKFKPSLGYSIFKGIPNK